MKCSVLRNVADYFPSTSRAAIAGLVLAAGLTTVSPASAKFLLEARNFSPEKVDYTLSPIAAPTPILAGSYEFLSAVPESAETIFPGQSMYVSRVDEAAEKSTRALVVLDVTEDQLLDATLRQALHRLAVRTQETTGFPVVFRKVYTAANGEKRSCEDTASIIDVRGFRLGADQTQLLLQIDNQSSGSEICDAAVMTTTKRRTLFK